MRPGPINKISWYIWFGNKDFRRIFLSKMTVYEAEKDQIKYLFKTS